MTILRDVWQAIRETSFVIVQVVTLGILALVLGVLAFSAILRQPAASTLSPGPARPLQALIPTLVPDTPTPTPREASAPAIATVASTPTATAGLYVPPVVQTPTVVPSPAPPTVVPTESAAPAPPPPPPTATPKPAPPKPTSTSTAAGQMMKVLPATDGLPARVRAEPSTRSPILVRVPLGATVEVLGSATGDEVQPGNAKWLKIRWKDVTGYVHSTLVGAP